MKNIKIIVGGNGAGKTYLQGKLQTLGWNPVVSVTTRDARVGEVNGVDYEFISCGLFNELKRTGKLLESIEFQDNQYGISFATFLNALKETNKCSIVVEPNGVQQIINYFCNNKINDEYLVNAGDVIDIIFLDLSMVDRLQNLVETDQIDFTNPDHKKWTESALKRITRNGDSIADDFSKWIAYGLSGINIPCGAEQILYLNGKGISTTIINFKTVIEVNEYIENLEILAEHDQLVDDIVNVVEDSNYRRNINELLLNRCEKTQEAYQWLQSLKEPHPTKEIID